MSKLKLYWWPVALSILLIFSFCSRPTEFEQSGFLYTSPEKVVANLTLAYKEKNLEGYSSSFRDDSQFYQESEYLWGKAQEEQIHRKMFAAVKGLDLKLEELRSEEATETTRRTVYNYQLNVKLLGEQTLQGEGQVALDFVKNERGSWQINLFQELRTELRKLGQEESNKIAQNDSVDYFPLRVGNQWTYENQLFPMFPKIQTIVVDSLMIRGNIYYCVKDFEYPFVTYFLRVDSLQQLKTFIPTDSSELTIFNFKAAIGDSLIFIPPSQNGIAIVELISKKDSVSVPAGTFKNISEFLITDFNSGSRFVYEFAEDIGMIRQRGTNQVLVLKSAQVNGKKYPIVVSVETRYFNWTKIKLSFK